MKIYVNNRNGIEAETSKAILIKIPGSTKKFWMPSKLVYPSKLSNYYTVYIPDDFEIHAAKSKEKLWHDEIEERFDGNKKNYYRDLPRNY